MELRVYFDGECDWVIAESEEDAWKVWCESNGESREDYEEDKRWEALSDEHQLTIWDDDAGFGGCNCRETIQKHREDERKQIALIEMQAPPIRGHLLANLPKPPKTHPNGHLVTCNAGHKRHTCAEWVKIEGRGFLCSTEF